MPFQTKDSKVGSLIVLLYCASAFLWTKNKNIYKWITSTNTKNFLHLNEFVTVSTPCIWGLNTWTLFTDWSSNEFQRRSASRLLADSNFTAFSDWVTPKQKGSQLKRDNVVETLGSRVNKKLVNMFYKHCVEWTPFVNSDNEIILLSNTLWKH